MAQVVTLFSKNFLGGREKYYLHSSDLNLKNWSNLLFEANDPDADDDELRRYYSVKVGSVEEAERLVEALMKLPDVEASWVKPQEGPPK